MAQVANLRAWIRLRGGQKVDLFEKMAELASESGVLRSERLALWDCWCSSRNDRLRVASLATSSRS